MPQLRLPDLVIDDGATESNALGPNDLRQVRCLGLFAPAALAGVTTVQVTHVREPEAADWVALQIGGADVVLTASKALFIDFTPFQGLRLSTDVAPSGTTNVIGVVGEESGGFAGGSGY